MNPRYQPGGDIYADIETRYGPAAANRVYAAAAADPSGAALRAILSDLHTGASPADYTGSTSTLENFWDQITTDPLSAPLESANRQLGNAVWNIVKNPFVLLAVVALVLYWLGGFGWLKRNVFK